MSTSHNRLIRLDLTAEVLLFAVSFENRFKLALFHTRLDFSENLDMSLDCDLCGPSHDVNFGFALNGFDIAENIVDGGLINIVPSIVGLFWDK